MKVRIDESAQCSACAQKTTNAMSWATSTGSEINICFECLIKAAEVARKIEDE